MKQLLKLNRSIVWLALLFISVSIPWSVAFAGTIYFVDQSHGKDTYNGTTTTINDNASEGPWKTIAKVNSTNFSAGDSILFKKGEIWREELRPRSSGSLFSWITYGAYGTGENPIINGADAVYTWKLTNLLSILKFTPIYESNITWTPISVLNGGKFMAYVPWNTNVTTMAQAMAAGTWTFDPANKNLYVWLSDGADPSTHTIEATRRSCLFGSGADWIKVENMTFIHSNYAGLDTNGGNGWLVSHCTAHHNSDYGIKASAGSTDCVIEDCTGHDELYGLGANVATNLIVRRCTSYENIPFRDGDGMQFNKVIGLLVELCNVYNNHNIIGTSSDNIQINDTTNAIIRYNHVHGGCNSNIIFTGNDSFGDVYYNLIEEGINGINIHGVTQRGDINVYNNTIYAVTNYPLHIYKTDSGYITIKNNIVHGTTYALVVESTSVDPFKITFNNNCYYNDSGSPFFWRGAKYATLASYQTATSQDLKSIFGDPQFISISSRDFSLRPTSPCISAGVDVHLERDYAGTLLPYAAGVDIGAYQYNDNAFEAPQRLRTVP
jgi:hypothetical protein